LLASAIGARASTTAGGEKNGDRKQAEKCGARSGVVEWEVVAAGMGWRHRKRDAK
jgi:hypothetical protein